MEPQIVSLPPEKNDAQGPPPADPNPSSQPAVEAAGEEQTSEWNLGRQEMLVLVALVIVSFVGALDATLLAPVLPVNPLSSWAPRRSSDCAEDSCEISRGNHDRYLLGRHILFVELRNLSALLSKPF